MGWLGTWTHRHKITISNTNVDSALSNFPILVHISASSGTGSADITDIFTELGSDANRKKIAITTDNGTTQCYVEIERFDYANSKSWLWIKVPSISDSSGTELYIYYDSSQSDNTTYVGDTTDAAAKSVWDSNFAAVYHMSQDPNDDVTYAIKDSTSNQNDGTPNGSMTSADLVDGKIGKAIDFDGSNDEIVLPASDDLYALDTITVESICKCTGMPTIHPNYRSTIYSTRDSGDTKGFSFWFDNDGGNKQITIQNRDSEGGAVTTANGVWSDNEICYIVMTHVAGTSQEIWKNGLSLVSDTQNWDFQKGPSTPKIGSETTGYFWKGILEEVRISNISRSAAWIKATYYSNWDELVAYGSAELFLEISCPSPFLAISSIQVGIQIEIASNLFTTTSSIDIDDIINTYLISCPSPFTTQSALQSSPQIEINQALFTATGSIQLQPEIRIFTGASLIATGSLTAIIEEPFSVAILPRVYTFTLTGAANGVDDIIIPIKSFQSRLKSGDPTYLSVVIPGTDYASAINLRLNGDLVVRMGYLSNGEIILSEIISIVNFENIIIYDGTTNKTITLDGHRTETFTPKEINLTGSSYKNINAGKLRYRCTPNLYVRPGDTVNIDDDSFTIKNITYSVSPKLETFEVSE